jgi:hypothetical protein
LAIAGKMDVADYMQQVVPFFVLPGSPIPAHISKVRLDMEYVRVYTTGIHIHILLANINRAAAVYKVATGESKSRYPFQEIKRIYLSLCWKKKNGAGRNIPHFIIAVLLFPFFSRIYLQRFYDIERRIEGKKEKRNQEPKG